MDIFLFVVAILSMLATAVIVHLVCKHTKLKALLTGTAFQLVKQIEAIFDDDQMQKHCTVQWYTIAALTLRIILLTIYICLTTQKCTIFKKRLFSNTVTVMLFFSNVKQYIPVKLCKTAGSIHLFQIYGQLCLRPNYFREKIFVGCDQNRLGRGLCDFEWSNNPIAHIGQRST